MSSFKTSYTFWIQSTAVGEKGNLLNALKPTVTQLYADSTHIMNHFWGYLSTTAAKEKNVTGNSS